MNEWEKKELVHVCMRERVGEREREKERKKERWKSERINEFDDDDDGPKAIHWTTRHLTSRSSWRLFIVGRWGVEKPMNQALQRERRGRVVK